MDFSEIKELKVGNEIAIRIGRSFFDTTVVRPLFWNSDADEPDWELETDDGFVDVYSIYEVTKR
jgi:hypothetical protein